MLPRVPLLAAIRRPAALLMAPSASLSTTPSSQAVRNDSATATSSILNIDGDTSSPPRDPTDSTERAYRVFERISTGARYERGSADQRSRMEDSLRERSRDDEYARQMLRRWRFGDVYTPRDLGPGEMSKWRRASPRKVDLVDMLGLRPLDMYKNFSVISEFMTPHGRIRKSIDTGLRPPNQRKMAKAIRRAIGLGIHPSVHQHPELLERTAERRHEQNQATLNKGLNWI
ncbi:ribosomal protein S18 [Camillea tinctor]|nr:ribosomal protein S18 [Camillea tinctor]